MNKPDFSDPAWLDTLAFAGASATEIRQHALAGRAGLRFFDRPLAMVRLRLEQRPGAARPVLVFLPDGPASIESYDNLIEALGDDFDLVILEIPGFGYSYPKAPQALEFETLVDITAAAVASLGLSAAIWLGPCVQGLVTIGVAKRHPALVRGLVVMQTGDWAAESRWGRDAEPDLVVDAPARVVWGLADKSHADTDRATLLRYLPQAQVTELERVGHFVDLEAIDVMREMANQLST